MAGFIGGFTESLSPTAISVVRAVSDKIVGRPKLEQRVFKIPVISREKQ